MQACGASLGAPRSSRPMHMMLLRRPSLLGARARPPPRALPLDAAAANTVANAANAAVPSPSPTSAPVEEGKPPLFYDAIAFDMDGTLSSAHIPFADMRRRTEIPVGDLFTVMESWEESGASSGDESDGGTDGGSSSGGSSRERVKRAMDVILEIEANAAATTAPMEGLADLLRLLERRRVHVALVTRNTPRAVEAFFTRAFAAADPAAGDDERARWRALFDPVITRHDRFVKPDRRLLWDLAERWGVREMGRMLMVGDSLEDCETGNATGAASCLVAGGGNEAPGAAPVAPPPGAVPTFSVRSLGELRDLLLASAPDAPPGDSGSSNGAPSSSFASSVVRYGWALGDSDEAAAAAAAADPRSPGAPAPGLPFVDWCAARGAFRRASVSFPRIAHAAGGFAACGDTKDRPDRVLHVGCAEGALTKLLASSGLLCVGVDGDVSAALTRGLAALPLGGGGGGSGGGGGGGASSSSSSRPSSARELAAGDLEAALRERGPFDAVLLLPPGGPLDALSPQAAAEAARVLRPGGVLACELVGSEGRCVEGAEADARTALDDAGLELVEIGRQRGGGNDGGASGDVVLWVLARRPE